MEHLLLAVLNLGWIQILIGDLFEHINLIQVKEHLEESILQLPKNDYRSRDFLVQIADDEEKHRETVKNIGSNEIPDIIRKAMQTSSNIMKKLTSLI